MDEENDRRDEGISHKVYSPMVLALVGAIVLGIGVIIWKSWTAEETRVEIVSDSSNQVNEGEGEIVIEVAGAVMKPGVYNLAKNSRIEDGLVAAGGLTSDADRDWLSKYINRAKVMVDGEKVYIPASGEMTKIANEGISTMGQSSAGGRVAMININTASQSQLEDLWGVGEATAKKIIDGRPFGSVEELLSKKIVKGNVYEEIKDEISVY